MSSEQQEREQEQHLDALPYSVTIVNEFLGFPILEGAMTNSTGMNDLLKKFLGWNQHARGRFMNELIEKGRVEHVALKDSPIPYTIYVAHRRLLTDDAPNPNEVILYACEPGDPIALNHVPKWFDEAIEASTIQPVVGDFVDGSDWVYLEVTNGTSKMMCKTDSIIGRHGDGTLYVRDQ